MGIPPGAAFFTGLSALRLRPGSLGLKDRACEAAVLERIFWEARRDRPDAPFNFQRLECVDRGHGTTEICATSGRHA